MAECFSEKSGWCRNEQVCQGVKCFERSVRLDTALCKRCPLSSVDGERHITPVVTFVSSNLC